MSISIRVSKYTQVFLFTEVEVGNKLDKHPWEDGEVGPGRSG